MISSNQSKNGLQGGKKRRHSNKIKSPEAEFRALLLHPKKLNCFVLFEIEFLENERVAARDGALHPILF